MAFLKRNKPENDGVCDNCGNDLDDGDDPIEDGEHQFCSTDCKKSYADEHEHDDEEEANVCEFC